MLSNRQSVIFSPSPALWGCSNTPNKIFLIPQVARVATYPQRVTLATVLACVVWGGVAIPECSVDILGVDEVIFL